MKERPILFSAPMVRAILAGAKTQTRRIVKPQPSDDIDNLGDGDAILDMRTGSKLRCPYGVPSDRLWVRETHAQFAVGNSSGVTPQCVAYRATCDEDGGFTYVNDVDSEIMRLQITKWAPAIHMPRWASRITLEITDVRAQRLQHIDGRDAVAEGARRFDDIPDPHPYQQGARWSMFDPKSTDECMGSPRSAFANAWNSIHGDGAWDANPWVWAVTFKRVDR